MTEDTIRVSHTHLYGVGAVKNKIESPKGGNFIVVLDGVVDPNAPEERKVPTLDHVDWYPEGSSLNLVFHPVDGQRFESLSC